MSSVMSLHAKVSQKSFRAKYGENDPYVYSPQISPEEISVTPPIVTGK